MHAVMHGQQHDSCITAPHDFRRGDMPGYIVVQVDVQALRHAIASSEMLLVQGVEHS